MGASSAAGSHDDIVHAVPIDIRRSHRDAPRKFLIVREEALEDPPRASIESDDMGSPARAGSDDNISDSIIVDVSTGHSDAPLKLGVERHEAS